MEEKITEHFSLKEFTRSEKAEKYHIDNSIPEALKPRIRLLCEQVLEPLRAHFGPIKVTSGYRCEALNAAVKGAKNSQHTQGEAADIIPIPSCGGRSFDSAQDDIKGERSFDYAQDDRLGARNDKNSGNSLKMIFLWMMDNLQFDQLILEPFWIHVSYREGKNRQQVIFR